MIDEITDALNTATEIDGVTWTVSENDEGLLVLEWLVEAGSDADTGDDLSDALDGPGGVADVVADRFGLEFDGNSGGASGCISDGVRYTGGAYSQWRIAQDLEGEDGLRAVLVHGVWCVEDEDGGMWFADDAPASAAAALEECRTNPTAGVWKA